MTCTIRIVSPRLGLSLQKETLSGQCLDLLVLLTSISSTAWGPNLGIWIFIGYHFNFAIWVNSNNSTGCTDF